MPGKRKSTLSYNARFKRARMAMRTQSGYRSMLSRNLPARFGGRGLSVYWKMPQVVNRVNNLYKMIETKECTRGANTNVGLPHNNIYVVVDGGTGLALNPFNLNQGAGDEMGVGGNRVGDQIALKGLMIKGFFENALARPKVYYRVMLLRGAKGETFSRSTIFKGDCPNKMIDQVNTERFTVVAQKIFNAQASNVAASGTEVSGAPLIATAGGVGTRTFKMWIPGSKFGRGGAIQYENNSTQVKFYDYRICIMVYDWYGTPQDVNNVGKLNDMYTKLYFKDA